MLNFAFELENGFATHQVLLSEAVGRTTGPVIEFGCGEGSTVMLHELCKATKRRLISVDNNPGWLARYRDKYQTDWHRFYLVPPDGCTGAYHDCQHWDPFLKAMTESAIHWGVVFVDQAPWEARTKTILAMKPRCDYIVLHDSSYFPENPDGLTENIFGTTIEPLRGADSPGYRDYSDMFEYFHEYYPQQPWPDPLNGPPTLLASDFHECQWKLPTV